MDLKCVFLLMGPIWLLLLLVLVEVVINFTI